MNPKLLPFRALLKRLQSETTPNKTLWALLFSTLVYFSPEFIIKITKDIGADGASLQEVGDTGLRFLWVSFQGQEYVAFRGTEATIWANWKRVLNFIPKRTLKGRKAHRGFVMAFEDCRRVLVNLLTKPEDAILTGHSLGGAISILGAEYFNAKAITFASPKVFFNEKVNDRIPYTGYRTIGDWVPHLPFTFFFFVWSRAKPDYWISTDKNLYVQKTFPWFSLMPYHRMGTYIEILMEKIDETGVPKTKETYSAA